MDASTPFRLSKSDFMLFCEAPRHLWAKAHGALQVSLTDFDQHLMNEGNKVEALAREYLTDVLLPHCPGVELIWQRTYSDGPFLTRLDGLVHKPATDSYDLYEIKSSTKVSKEIELDVSYQAAILQKHIPVDHYFVVHLNREYIRNGALDLSSLFIAEDVTATVLELLPSIELCREAALDVLQLPTADHAAHCLTPKSCPCPAICHPDLPEFSIYDIPALSQSKKRQLLDAGIRSARDIPEGFELSAKQQLVADCAITGKAHINARSITSELEQFQFPLYFLDYETCISALPLFDGYRPQQQNVFQYSLHRLDAHGNDLMHSEHVSLEEGDPALPLLMRLREDIGEIGTVIVWNKTFEKTRNTEMAKLYPEFAPFLERLNDRIYDLGDIVSQGHYVHPDFRGSWSIKNVLPVMVPELSYEGMSIGKGDQASMAWWKMTIEGVQQLEREQLTEALRRYCELDTRAMVEIYRKLLELIG